MPPPYKDRSAAYKAFDNLLAEASETRVEMEIQNNASDKIAYTGSSKSTSTFDTHTKTGANVSSHTRSHSKKPYNADLQKYTLEQLTEHTDDLEDLSFANLSLDVATDNSTAVVAAVGTPIIPYSDNVISDDTLELSSDSDTEWQMTDEDRERMKQDTAAALQASVDKELDEE